ncbi:MAG: prephenate dehydrogenase/arogenate dehydrogenase family protein [Pyrinomonas methylaliphatogenes]|jgi:prephenate dehydrogenase|nr:prephenate dehydrogenase/arogenate dehydrogenase family protein [Pyrinomonas methylaliphatogenes]
MPLWERATIIGCGLIGASFALALRRTGACGRIAGWDISARALEEAKARAIIDEVDDAFASGGVSTSDLIYLAMPVQEIIRFLGARREQFKCGAVITDAGSTKFEICRAAAENLPDDRIFIGGHPIAGSQLTGLAHASPDLFAGACYVLIEEDQRAAEARAALQRTIELFGARVKLMTALEHDRAVAYISHLPQLLSSALAATIETHPQAALLRDLAGPGYRDMTRLAASSWTIWRDILTTNAQPIALALDAMIERLSAMRDELKGATECASLPKIEEIFTKRSS